MGGEDVYPALRCYARCAVPEEIIDRPRDQRKAAFVTAISGRNNPVESIMTVSQNRLGAFYSLSDFWKVVISGVGGECAIKKGVDACRRRHKNGDGDRSVSRVCPPPHGLRQTRGHDHASH